ncbi:MAG TPA: PEP/pyruvate-binding domain-containing protein [Kofleriaceae bacterium]
MTDSAQHVVQLGDPLSTNPALVGGKAARLAQLVREGFAVPDGFVCTVHAARAFYRDNALGPDSPRTAFQQAALPNAVRDALDGAAQGPWIVRSSAVEEDGAGRSYAGLYETIAGALDATQLASSVRSCWAAGHSGALAAYTREQAPGDLAVLVQRQLTPRVSGVATSEDVRTGQPHAVVVAVRGPSGALLEGRSDAEEWQVQRAGAASCTRSQGVLTQGEAEAVARLAVELAAREGAPQELEWVFEGERLHLVQVRPLPHPASVAWTAPAPGAWVRHVRLGGWLGAPVTPLFATWLLPVLEQGAAHFRRYWVGLDSPEPASVLVHGWYFSTVDFAPAEPLELARLIARFIGHLVRHPRRGSIAFMGPVSDPGTRLCLGEWDAVLRPRQAQLVQRAAQLLEAGTPAERLACVDELARAAADGLGLLSGICSAAWKAELLLSEFWRRHGAPGLDGMPQHLLCGLGDGAGAPAALSVDWADPTSDAFACDEAPANARLAAARASREQARARAIDALPRRQRRPFIALADRAVRFGRDRARCAREATESWTSMRRLLLAVGGHYAAAGRLADAHDIFYLERRELDALVASPAAPTAQLGQVAAARRRLRRAQASLTPPLQLGTLPAPFARALAIAEALRKPGAPAASGDRWLGYPASPGRVQGRARIVREPGALRDLDADDIAIVPVLTPALVPFVARARAAVAETGNHLAHSAVLARELGLPCVVGLERATSRVRDGEWLIVDGWAGSVERVASNSSKSREVTDGNT